MPNLNNLSPAALAAAMRGGTAGWGSHGSSVDHVRYMEPLESRRLCRCGCRKRETYIGKANGVGLASGCELSVMRWVRTGR